jgi:hypothetical protein
MAQPPPLALPLPGHGIPAVHRTFKTFYEDPALEAITPVLWREWTQM